MGFEFGRRMKTSNEGVGPERKMKCRREGLNYDQMRGLHWGE